jgi:hypothetical protein
MTPQNPARDGAPPLTWKDLQHRKRLYAAVRRVLAVAASFHDDPPRDVLADWLDFPEWCIPTAAIRKEYARG